MNKALVGSVRLKVMDFMGLVIYMGKDLPG